MTDNADTLTIGTPATGKKEQSALESSAAPPAPVSAPSAISPPTAAPEVVTVESIRTASRVALVIGNAAYSGAAKLTNPTNDAIAVGNALEKLGFCVVVLQDQTRQGMVDAMGQFIERLHSVEADVEAGLIYYAGHGVQIDGENYLLPTDISARNQMTLIEGALSLDNIIHQLESTKKAGLLFLDCCRNNPFPLGSRGFGGLAEVDPPAGIFIAYSTAPGAVAFDGDSANSPFTESLCGHLPAPGISVSQLMIRVRRDVYEKTKRQQMPWDSSSLLIDFGFNLGVARSLAEPLPAEEAKKKWDDEAIKKREEYWELTRKSDSKALLRSFIAQNPYSKHRTDAERKLSWLQWKERGFWCSVAGLTLSALIVGFVAVQWFRFNEMDRADLVGGDTNFELPTQNDYARSEWVTKISKQFNSSIRICRLKCIFSDCVAFSFDRSEQICYLKDETLFVDTGPDAKRTRSLSFYLPGNEPDKSPFNFDYAQLYVGDPIKPNGAPADLPDSRKDSVLYNAWGYRVRELMRLPTNVDLVKKKKNFGLYCQQACAKELKCIGFTYNPLHLRCKLFGSIRDIVTLPEYKPTDPTNPVETPKRHMQLSIPAVYSGRRP